MSDQPRQINLSRIPEAQRAEAWTRLKNNRPALAAWCRDPLVQAVKDAFDGELIIELPQVT